MPTTLNPGQKLKRVIRVYGVEQPVLVTLTAEGLDFRIVGQGKHLSLYAPWRFVVEHMPTPDNVKCFLSGKPVDMLNYLSAKVLKQRIKREEKKKENQ